jgi:integrin beta 3
MPVDPEAVAAAVRETIQKALAPVVARLAALEAQPPARDGRDGLPGAPGQAGRDGVAGAPGVDGGPGRDGTDGLGFDDFEASFDGERTLTLTWRSGARRKDVPVVLGVPVYRGVWQKSTRYTRGDCVTFGGSLWHAHQAPADAKPGDGSPCWQLAVKRGQDGKGA